VWFCPPFLLQSIIVLVVLGCFHLVVLIWIVVIDGNRCVSSRSNLFVLGSDAKVILT